MKATTKVYPLANEDIFDFILLKSDASYKQIEKGIEHICKVVLHNFYKRDDKHLLNGAKSFISEKLLTAERIEKDLLFNCVWNWAKNYYWNEIPGRIQSKLMYVEDIAVYEFVTEDQEQEDYTDFKQDIIKRLRAKAKEIEKEITNNHYRQIRNRNIILCLNALSDCIQFEQDYESKFMTLYLMRKTGFRTRSIRDIFLKIKINIILSDDDAIIRILNDYKGIKTSTGKFIEDWEKHALHGHDQHKSIKSSTYEHRKYYVSDKATKSNKVDRIKWLSTVLHFSKDEQLKGYITKFGLSYNTFMFERQQAKKLTIISSI